MLLTIALMFAQPPAPDPVGPPAVQQVKLPDKVKPPEIKTPVGVPVRLASKVPVSWEVGCDGGKRFYLIPDADGLSATVIAADPGSFTVLAIAAKGDKATPASRTVIVAGEPDPIPVPPVPVPPVPTPPVPVPPVPVPVDPFATAIRVAFVADIEPGKADKAATLAEVYRQAARLAVSADITTAAGLVEKVRGASTALGLTPTDLATVRVLVAAELKLAADAAGAFDDAARKKLADVYRRAAAGLSQ